MEPALSIGEFSRVSHLTVRMLRRYHDSGLLEPDRVDPVTGYRYYSLEQVPVAQAIRRFRALDLPMAELRELLSTSDDARRDQIVVTHLSRLEDKLAQTQEAIRSLRGLLGPQATVPVTVLEMPARRVLAVRAVVDTGSVLDWYAAARAELVAAAGNATPTGPPGGRYAHELFTEGRGDVLVHLPCDGGRARGRVESLVLPSRTVAVVTHRGPHEDIDSSYAALGSWVLRRGSGVEGPVEEIYDVGPADDPDPRAWRTRLAWPVTG